MDVVVGNDRRDGEERGEDHHPSNTRGRSDHQETTFQEALNALMSPIHQATDRESLQKSAERRIYTVSDMRRYLSRIRFGPENDDNDGGDGGKTTQNSFRPPKRMIHITGTKGKGSTASFCQAILRSHGYSTGLFTSPHLIDIRERIRLDGHPVHQNLFAKAYWKIRNDLETYNDHTSSQNGNEKDDLPILPGYFRMLTLMAFYIFSQLEVDIWIIEVGMGGRYDATNFLDRNTISDRYICGVTLLDLDHTRILGDTLDKIAWEKGGILAIDKETTKGLSPRPTDVNENESDDVKHLEEPKRSVDSINQCEIDDVSGTAFILDSNTAGVLGVFQQCATNEGCGGRMQTVESMGTELRLALGRRTLGIAGDHQYGNANLAVHLCRSATLELRPGQGVRPTMEDYLHDAKTLQGLMDVQWPARCQSVRIPGSSHLTFRLDGAHTPLSLAATIEWFRSKSASSRHRILIFNCSHERNPIELLELLVSKGSVGGKLKEDDDKDFTGVYFAQPDSSRPSPVRKPLAHELLHEANIPVNEDWVTSIRVSQDETWQETLGILWKHLGRPSTITNPNTSTTTTIEPRLTPHKGQSHDDDDLHTSRDDQVPPQQLVVCNKTSIEILEDLRRMMTPTTTLHEEEEPIEVLVTGSLYIVGSFLNALEWSEESSPDKSMGLGL